MLIRAVSVESMAGSVLGSRHRDLERRWAAAIVISSVTGQPPL
jgi:hypothetical protein